MELTRDALSERPCLVCGALKQWTECPVCRGIGAYALAPDGFEIECDDCDGSGGYYRCPNVEDHVKVKDACF